MDNKNSNRFIKKLREYKLKEKKIFFLVIIMVIVIIGSSNMIFANKLISVTSRTIGNKTIIDNSKNKKNIIKSDAPEESELYKQAEKISGLTIPRLTMFPSGTTFDNGSVNVKANTLHLQYDVAGKYIIYELSTNKKQLDYICDKIHNNDFDISIFKNNSDYIAFFEYYGYYFYVTSNISEKDFYGVIENLIYV